MDIIKKIFSIFYNKKEFVLPKEIWLTIFENCQKKDILSLRITNINFYQITERLIKLKLLQFSKSKIIVLNITENNNTMISKFINTSHHDSLNSVVLKYGNDTKITISESFDCLFDTTFLLNQNFLSIEKLGSSQEFVFSNFPKCLYLEIKNFHFNYFLEIERLNYRISIEDCEFKNGLVFNSQLTTITNCKIRNNLLIFLTKEKMLEFNCAEMIKITKSNLFISDKNESFKFPVCEQEMMKPVFEFSRTENCVFWNMNFQNGGKFIFCFACA